MSIPLNEGDWAPDFSLPDGNGRSVKLSDFRGKKSVVLYFYPKDDTPGCTREACNFRDSLDSFKQVEAEILGVSLDSVTSHERFASKYNLPFTLLSDHAKTVSKMYGVLRPTRTSTERVTFIIDRQGIIRKIYPHVKVDGHNTEVLEVLRGLEKASA